VVKSTRCRRGNVHVQIARRQRRQELCCQRSGSVGRIRVLQQEAGHEWHQIVVVVLGYVVLGISDISGTHHKAPGDVSLNSKLILPDRGYLRRADSTGDADGTRQWNLLEQRGREIAREDGCGVLERGPTLKSCRSA